MIHSPLYSKAYFTQDDVNGGIKKWQRAIRMAIQSSKPQVNFSDKELAVYLMNKIDEFTETATAMPGYSDVKVKAVSVTGLQQPPEWASQADREMKVWVLNESVQINEDGNILQPGTTPYFWIGDICKKRIELFKPDRLTGEFPIADPRKRSIALPQLDGQVLVRLISAMKENYAGNIAGALLALGGYTVALHYEALIEEYKKVPATIIYGEVQCGKSMLTRAVLSTMGIQETNFFIAMSDSRTFAFSSQTTLGMVLDDPSDVKQVSKKLTYHFQKGSAATVSYEYTPRTTFLTSMNEPTLKQLAKSARYVGTNGSVHNNLFKGLQFTFRKP